MPGRPAAITLSGHLLLPDGAHGVRLGRGAIRVRDGLIEAVEETDSLPAADFGGDDFLIAPAFSDTHLHLPQFDSIGVRGFELLDWLDRVIFPAEARWADADFAGEMAGRVARQLLSFGTVGVGAYATVHHAAARAAGRVLAAAGLRGHVGQVLMDQNAPPELLRPAAQLLGECVDHAPVGRIHPAVTPRFAVSCGCELLHGAGTAASLTGWAIQTHLAETRRECDLVRELHGGLGYVEVYRAAGLLTPRTLLGHGIWLDAADHAVIAASGAGIAHCPTANLFLDAGAMDRAAAAEAGVAVSLGSDVAGGPDRSMVRVARAMIDTAVSLGRATPTAARAWWQITTGNAAALGDDDAGRLAPGAPADLLCILPDSGWEGTPDPLSMLLHAWDDRWIRTTLVLGRPAFTA